MWSLLLSAYDAVAGKISPELHGRLHEAIEHPEHRPPVIPLPGDSRARLQKHEIVFDYKHEKGHEIAIASAMTEATPEHVWQAIYDVNHLSKYLPALKKSKLMKSIEGTERDELDADLHFAVPNHQGHLKLQGFHYKKGGYMAFHMVNHDHTPFTHLVGYYVVQQIGPHTLLTLVVDGEPVDAIPSTVDKKHIGEKIFPGMLEGLRKKAEELAGT